MSESNWLQGLDESTRERVFVEMRALRTQSDRHNAEAARLSPRGGAIAAGGAHFDEFLKGDAIANFLRKLGQGGTPDEAVEYAKAEARFAVAKWNEQRKKDVFVHRWEGTADTIIDTAGIRVRRAAGLVTA